LPVVRKLLAMLIDYSDYSQLLACFVSCFKTNRDADRDGGSVPQSLH